MKVLVSTLLTLLLSVPAFAGNGRVVRKQRPLPDRYVVQFADFVESAEEVAADILQKHGGKLRYLYRYGLKGMAVQATSAQAARISADYRVVLVEQDSPATPLQVAPASPPGWARDRINQRDLPLDHSAATGCNSAPGVTAYILDTGINPSSTEFGTRLRNGWSFNGNFSDEHPASTGHGTPVASIVGGANYGVAPGVNLVNVKVWAPSIDGTGVSEMMAGVDFVIGEHYSSRTSPKVINMSMKYDPSDILDAKVRSAIAEGILVVVGAGNEGTYACDIASPARLGKPNNPGYNDSPYSTITVSSTTLVNSWSLDARAYMANMGECVDIFAPTGGDALGKGGGKVTFGGTSGATPYVTGEVARLLRGWIGVWVDPTTFAAQIEDSLKASATSGKIRSTDIGVGSPNLLLYVGYAKCRS